jgi:hypothetical protein
MRFELGAAVTLRRPRNRQLERHHQPANGSVAVRLPDTVQLPAESRTMLSQSEAYNYNSVVCSDRSE